MEGKINTLINIVIEHLPDSISKRREILETLLELVPDTHDRREFISAMLAGLEHHEQAQLQFRLSGAGRAAA